MSKSNPSFADAYAPRLSNVSSADQPSRSDGKIKRKLVFQVTTNGDLGKDARNDGPPCEEFDQVDKVAERFVDILVNESLGTAVEVPKSTPNTDIVEFDEEEDDDSVDEVDSSSVHTFVEFYGSFTEWPTIKNFTIETGEDAIEEYISTWYYEEEWLYNVELILQQSDECSDYYIFETKWSIPTKEYPIPQATASIFFNVEVSRVKPAKCPVQVTYQFEGCSYVHCPFKHSFNERWLFNIIQSKLNFYKTLTF